ncbi:MAG TPA: protein translocase subunit SecD [Candidatus Nanopelagicaceae bacterium]|nr:protein translocase subunit SecD [Candidatus Nanopelagicaceae bacterium]
MARANTPTSSRPGRSLLVLLAIFVILGATAVIQGASSVKLGLDLRGGTSVTLQPRIVAGQKGKVTSAAIDQAVAIIRQRVNSLGVAESEVTATGSGTNRQIVISVPGDTGRRIVQLVGQTAELRFRQVLVEGAPGLAPAPSASPSPSPSTSASVSATPTPTAKKGKSAPHAAGTASPSPSTSPNPTVGPSVSPTATPPTTATSLPADVTPAMVAKYNALDCTKLINRQGGGGDDPNLPLVSCDRNGTAKYILSKAEVLGSEIKSASAVLDQTGGGGWMVLLNFNGAGTTAFANVTSRVVGLAAPQNQVAIVLDGLVVSAPRIISAITAGSAQITGNFTQTDSSDLANVLKYGALPLAFDSGEVQQISPTLGADQLHAGLLAGAIGLFLVLLYSLLYYRGLGLVSVGSLAIAGGLTYLFTLVLGKTIGFTLTLAGIAGLIVSIGITADSFIVFFERLRDEVREGKTLRSAVETGWVRARHTIIVADAVSLIASVLLYFFAVGGVRGFAFTLGLTTMIDLLIVFTFTKPLVTLLVRTKFYGGGHPLSGLSPDRLGAKTSMVRAPSTAQSSVQEA